MVRFLKPEYSILVEQKLPCLEKMIATRQVPTYDDDDTDDEYDDKELLLEFKKLISKHMKL
jgi:hypothetical protein